MPRLRLAPFRAPPRFRAAVAELLVVRRLSMHFMKLMSLFACCFLTSGGFSADTNNKIPRLIGELPMSGGDNPMRYGTSKNGMRIGLTSESPTYRLNHRINVWCSFQTKRTLTDFDAVTPNHFSITHPDGTVTQEGGCWPIDGPPGASFGGGLSDQLHYLIRKPGVYKLQWNVGKLKSGIVTFTIVPK